MQRFCVYYTLFAEDGNFPFLRALDKAGNVCYANANR